jgi:hypothetical protein
VNPPSIGRACPVINDDFSEHNQTTLSATSSGFPNLPNGCSSINEAARPLEKMPSAIAVSITAGHTAFTRRLALQYSIAAALVSPITPALLA